MPPHTARDVGLAMHQFMAELYPICRSITGEGLRQTLRTIQQRIPITLQEVSSGSKVFDWTVPREWNINDAYVKNSKGERVIDFRKSNLHVISYSVPVRTRLGLDELKRHLFTIPEQPTLIPYRTSYYHETWGFCLAHRDLEGLEDGEYEVVIDSSLGDGHLTYGELLIGGEEQAEVLVSTHACHPSLCNDNLSGIALATFLAEHLGRVPLRYSYRFLFIPGTVGSITWLALNEQRVSRITHGLVLACLGDAGKISYKRSRRHDAEIDRAVVNVLRNSGKEYALFDFSPYGYDERQYCSPGFNLPVGCLSRTPHGRFPEYHTSADNLELTRPEALADSFATVLSIVDVLEQNRKYVNTNPKCEPQLGRRGLYGAIGGQADRAKNELAMLWVLNLSDGAHSLLDISDRSGLAFGLIRDAAHQLARHGLLAHSA